MSEIARWYVLHTYSGYENTVASAITKHVDNRNLHHLINEVKIPMEKVTEMTDKGPKEYERKTFPGYVLVKMILTDETWHILRNIRGVTGFVGEASNKPIPLSEEEVLAMGMEKHEIEVKYAVGSHVKIVDGPLSSFTGVVEEIEPEKNRVSVMVSMFGRETPVELELDQLELME